MTATELSRATVTLASVEIDRPPESQLLAGLNPVQLDAVTHGDGPILVVAGAGSGKTRVLAHRVAYLIRERGINPFSVLAITFTNKAAGEMVDRVGGLLGERLSRGMWVRTFHSACVRILRRQAEVIGFKPTFSIYDASDSERLITMCLRDLGMEGRQFPPRTVKSRISRAKNELIGPAEYQERTSSPDAEAIARVFELYEQRLIGASAMDFDDLLVRTVGLLRDHPGILDFYQRAFRHILVDEFQDTNAAQWELVRLLAAEHRNVFCVGDADQSIYKFRGADIANINGFEKAFPDAEVLLLEQNYRSTQTILDAANAVISNNSGRLGKNLWSEHGEGEKIVLHNARDERGEADFVAGEIAELVERADARYRDIAVFYRTNAQSRIIEESFARYSIPYRVVGGTRFYDRREIRDALAYLRSLANPDDGVSLRRIINVPRRGIGDSTLSRISAWAESEGKTLTEAIGSAGGVSGVAERSIKKVIEFAGLMASLRDELASIGNVAPFVERVLESTGYLPELEDEASIESLGRAENVRELIGMAIEFDHLFDVGEIGDDPDDASPADATVGGRLAAFLEQVSLVADVDELTDEGSAVTLMTLHNAKGLEYPIAFIVGMEDTIFPHIRSMTDQSELEEERRLCYVGITRAEQKLYLTHAWNRSLYGNSMSNPPSKFISEIPSGLLSHSGDGAADHWESFGRGDSSPGSSAARSQVPKRFRVDASTQTGPHEALSISIGDDVVHEKWGEGVVLEVSGSGEDAQATIRFPDPEIGEKRLLLSWAPLTRA